MNKPTHKPYPKEAVDTLPENHTILGWGGEFERNGDFDGYAWEHGDDSWDNDIWSGRHTEILYAATSDSEIVKLNTDAPTTVLPEDAAERKQYPVYSGFIKYFPHAIAEVAHLSYQGNKQHHDGTPTHWDMDKSGDELDALMRHTLDGCATEDIGEATRRAWRAMADLERKLTGKCQYTNQMNNE